jgi:putative redox protein
MNVSYISDLKFIAENGAGQKIPVEPSVILGGSGKTPNPIDYLLASIGSCAGIKVLLDLSEKNIKPDSLKVTLSGTRRETPPAIFEKIHLPFILAGKIDERVVAEAIHEAMTLTCPVAVMMGRASEITWDYRIT